MIAHPPLHHRLAAKALAAAPVVVPVVGAVVMAWLFRQPGLLFFGVMGPVVAWLQVLGRKKQALDQEAGEVLERQHAEASARQEAWARVCAWREGLVEARPPVTHWLENPLWRPEEQSSSTSVRVGVTDQNPPKELGWRESVPGIPVTIPLHSTVALVGQGPRSRSVWRALWCQALAIIASGSPGRAPILVGPLWPPNAEVPDSLAIPGVSGRHRFWWQRHDSVAEVSPETTLVIVVGTDGFATVYRRGVVIRDGVTPDRLSFSQARWVRARLVAQDNDVSAAVVVDPSDRRSLWCDVGESSTPLDLVQSGPHAVVWGKTGSGKSVLVQRLVLSLCQRYTPDRLAIVGIDFKGGATLQPLVTLPHVSGSVTDLTVSISSRVARSLAAEMRSREHLFHRHQVSTWSDLDDRLRCPRVLIVVDEAGVVASQAPELMTVLDDVASRGRSLGLHLLLSTQRPQHLPANIMANCALRVCLGVTDQEEAARYLDATPKDLLQRLLTSRPGQALWPGSGDTPQFVSVEPVTADEITAVEEAGSAPAHRLWCEELPTVIRDPDLSDLVVEEGELLIGQADDPDNQHIIAATFSPRRDGPLVLIGESGSGHTTCLEVLSGLARAQQIPVVWATGPAELFCHTLMQIVDRLNSTSVDLAVIVDRLDRILAATPSDAEAWVVETLSDIALAIGARGNRSFIAVSTGPGSPAHSALLRWAATPVLLRHLVSDQWAISGGHPSLHDPKAPPGRAVVAGMSVQWRMSAGEETARSIDVGHAPAGCLVVGNRLPEAGGYSLLSAIEAESQWSTVNQALAAERLTLTELSPSAMRHLVGGGRGCPPVMAHLPYGWWFTPEGPNLVTL